MQIIQVINQTFLHQQQEFQKMGTCASKRLSPSTEKLKIKEQIAKMYRFPNCRKLSVTHWPGRLCVDFKDTIKSSNKIYELSLQNQQQQTFQVKDGQFHLSQQNSQDLICKMKKSARKIQISFNNQKVWHSAQEFTELKQNSTCLVGTTLYKLIKIVQKNNHPLQDLKGLNNPISAQSLPDADTRCRVCYSTKESQINPFVNPCNCKGSIQFIHLNCLSDWLFGKRQVSQFLHLETKKVLCQLCKTNITQTDTYKKIICGMMDGKRALNAPYAVFQGSKINQPVDINKTYMILSFATKKQYVIGRSEGADVSQKNDPFISRLNSAIQYKDNKIYIKDLQSKHGTGILIQQTLQFGRNNPKMSIIYQNMCVQVDCSFLQSVLKR